MIPRTTAVTRTVQSAADLLSWVSALGPGRLDVVVDEAVAPHPPVDGLLRTLQRAVTNCAVLPQGPGSTAEDLARRLRSGSVVVAVGGGSVIDRAKLAVRAGADDCTPYLSTRHRAAMVLLPPRPLGTRPLAAVPTTLGTGSEVSKAAVHVGGGRRRLVVGEGIQPDLALHAPRLTTGLPDHLVAEGVLEIVARLIGPYVGDPRPRPVEDAVVEALLRVLGPLLVRAGDGALTLEDRAQLLRIGSMSHQDAVVDGRSPYAVKWWALTNEICAATGVRKVPALTAVLPVVMDRLLGGDGRWGSAERLRHVALVLSHATAELLPAAPEAGLRALLQHLGLRTAPAVADLPAPRVAHAVHRGWGAGLPMFAGFREHELVSLAEDVALEAAALPRARELPPTGGRSIHVEERR
ncbi:NADP-dependent alcohol dehydrogenase [Georgenia satyanarayanai]|uniref:NADP-dependent alcohol dehydrogenase n=1 Tax=Georgenia satyanarayanai TaxID=860221 RepID=A0A2Y9AN80_9MICO|nr:daptide-type RiPP biosynthesis dehydogenase [Georgenia satyanarayanai]PYF98940.1 NADP-dependent alcohol dehydrogenase [Georgenia satyanarayanai]SSA44788.1 NADP-dependent alcohol dehydrogenase [Georgenia satyanarayanai]